jgi:hypothetical protein
MMPLLQHAMGHDPAKFARLREQSREGREQTPSLRRDRGPELGWLGFGWDANNVWI